MFESPETDNRDQYQAITFALLHSVDVSESLAPRSDWRLPLFPTGMHPFHEDCAAKHGTDGGWIRYFIGQEHH
jgi:hypothetical protein